MKHWYVYIMSNKSNKVLYIGVTDDIESRVLEHKRKVFKNSFTAKYNCDKLVYFEEIKLGIEAVTREKQLKKWKRNWKEKLINEMNPGWSDLSVNWYSKESLILKTKRFLPPQE